MHCSLKHEREIGSTTKSIIPWKRMERSLILGTRCYYLLHGLDGFRLIHDTIRRQRHRFLLCCIGWLMRNAGRRFDDDLPGWMAQRFFHASISIVQHENAVRSIPGAFLEKNRNEGEKEKKAHAIEQVMRHRLRIIDCVSLWRREMGLV